MPKPRPPKAAARDEITVVIATAPSKDADARCRRIVEILLAAIARRARGEAA